MCNGGTGGTDALRRQEQQRQDRINTGMSTLNAIFNGGTYGINPATSFDKNASYFGLNGQPFQFDPKSTDYLNWLQANPGLTQQGRGGGGSRRNGGVGSGPRGAEDPATQAMDLQNRYMQHLAQVGGLYTGTGTSEGFGDSFLNQRASAFENYALPQFAAQYDQTNRQLQYSLANKGILGGSAATTANNALTREAGNQRQNIANQGLSLRQQLAQQIGQEKNALTNQLISSADPNIAAQGALAASTQFAAPSPLPPIGNLFGNFANMYLANQLGQTYNPFTYGMQQFRGPSLGFGQQSSQNIVR